ncbi:MAG TPA: TorF family putative porin [Xanthobacteraceae bacterium]
MKKVVLSVVAAVALASPALAADLKMLTKAPPPPPSPWDFAFGDALMTDYMWRGITQSAHRGSVAAYFEPRYNFTDTLQGYVGVSGESISFPNHAAAEIDAYGGIRPTFGKLALDFGAWLYYYPGGQCFSAGFATGTGAGDCGAFNAGNNWVGTANGGNGLLPNNNAAKAWASFFEVYGKATYTISDSWSIGAQVYYSPNVSNTGANGTYAAGTIKYTAPAGMPLPKDVGFYASVDGGYWWLGTSDAFYGTAAFPAGIPYTSFGNVDAGFGFTWKVFTLDFRYTWSGLNKGDCNAFTSDHTAGGLPATTAINPFPAPGSNWCSQTFLVKLSSDLTLANLK